MSLSALSQLQAENLVADERTQQLFREAAREAFHQNYTYMETAFRLGQRAEELGLEKDWIESILSEVFDAERRKANLSENEPVQVLDTTAPGAQPSAPSRFKKQTVGVHHLDFVEIPWPAETWRADLTRLLKSAFLAEDTFQLQNMAQEGRVRDMLVGEALKHEKELAAQMKNFDGKGAQIRVNPNSVGQKAVFRHALMEVRDLDLGRQLAFFRKFKLPASALINACGVSIQAWVRVDASNKAEFEERCVQMVKLFRDLGFEVDLHEASPVAAAWVPGVAVGGKQCYVIETQAGMADWDEWVAWSKAYLDGEPLIESSMGFSESPPENLEVLTGLVRQGHRVLLCGPAHSGKSLLAMDLALSIAHGEDWLGVACESSPVLYVNMETEPATFVQRMVKVAAKRGLPHQTEHLDFLQLMGLNKNPLEFVDFLTRRLEASRKWENKRYCLVIVDGLVDGLEGRGEDLGSPLGLLLDRLVVQSQVAVILTARSQHRSHLDPLVDAVLELRPSMMPDGSEGMELGGSGRFLKSKSLLRLRWNYPVFNRV